MAFFAMNHSSFIKLNEAFFLENSWKMTKNRKKSCSTYLFKSFWICAKLHRRSIVLIPLSSVIAYFFCLKKMSKHCQQKIMTRNGSVKSWALCILWRYKVNSQICVDNENYVGMSLRVTHDQDQHVPIYDDWFKNHYFTFSPSVSR